MSPFLDEEAFALTHKHLVCDFVLDHQGVEFLDFVAWVLDFDSLDDGAGIVLLLYKPTGLGAFWRETIGGFCPVLVDEVGIIDKRVDKTPVDIFGIGDKAVEVFDVAFRDILV